MPEERPDPRLSKPAVARFGVYEVNLRTGELRKHGNRMRLQEQPFQVLAMLLERPGGLVTRGDRGRKLGRAATSVDFDQSLNTAITRLGESLAIPPVPPVLTYTL